MTYAALALATGLAFRSLWGMKHGRLVGEVTDAGSEALHDVDWYQGIVYRVVTGLLWASVLGIAWSLPVAAVGYWLVDQAVWQVSLNRAAGNGFLSGEQPTTETGPWTSRKVFRNRRRILQAALGLSLLFIALFAL